MPVSPRQEGMERAPGSEAGSLVDDLGIPYVEPKVLFRSKILEK